MKGLISPDRNMLIKYNMFPHFLGAFPPFYCKTSNKFLVPKVWRMLYTLPLVFFIMFIDNLYLWIKVSPTVSSQKQEFQEFVNFYNHIISRTMACLFIWVFHFQMYDIMHFTNVIFEMEKYFEGTY